MLLLTPKVGATTHGRAFALGVASTGGGRIRVSVPRLHVVRTPRLHGGLDSLKVALPRYVAPGTYAVAAAVLDAHGRAVRTLQVPLPASARPGLYTLMLTPRARLHGAKGATVATQLLVLDPTVAQGTEPAAVSTSTSSPAARGAPVTVQLVVS